MHLAVDPAGERLGGRRDRADSSTSASSVSRSRAPVSGSRVVIAQRPTWPRSVITAVADAQRPVRASSSSAWALDAVDLEEHAEAARRRARPRRRPPRRRARACAREISETVPSRPRSTAPQRRPLSTRRIGAARVLAERRRPRPVDARSPGPPFRRRTRGDQRPARRGARDDAPVGEVQRELALVVRVVGDDRLERRQPLAVDHPVLAVDDEEAAVLGRRRRAPSVTASRRWIRRPLTGVTSSPLTRALTRARTVIA